MDSALGWNVSVWLVGSAAYGQGWDMDVQACVVGGVSAPVVSVKISGINVEDVHLLQH